MPALDFTKMEGAGNDFVFVDHRRRLFGDDQKSDLARRLCDRKFGVGADGLVLVEDLPDAPPGVLFAWDFYNNDGSRPGMCGNAARCAALFAQQMGMTDSKPFSFRTLSGDISVSLLPGGEVQASLRDAAAPRLHRGIEIAGTAWDAWFMDTGVPHAVVFCDDASKVDLSRLGPALRRHPAWGPEGANANFASRHGKGLLLRTYERGVEGETLACGTGATATAISAGLALGLDSPVEVKTAGGFVLTIGWQVGPDGHARSVTMTGPARKVYDGTIEIGT